MDYTITLTSEYDAAVIELATKVGVTPLEFINKLVVDNLSMKVREMINVKANELHDLYRTNKDFRAAVEPVIAAEQTKKLEGG